MPLATLDQLASPTSHAIPAPRRRWLTRLGIPAAIVLTTIALLAIAARDLWLPATSVTIIRAVAKPVQAQAIAAEPTHPHHSGAPGSNANTGTTVVAQAPGWVEPDPFPIRVPALAGGVVKEMLVLEGDEVKAEQVIARLIDDDAKLALRRAQADADRQKAVLDAAEEEWKNPVARERAVAVSQAAVQEAAAELATVDARIAADAAKVNELEGIWNRMKALPPGVLTEAELERARLQLDAQKASLDATKKQRAVAEAKARRAAAELAGAEQELRLRIAEKQALAEARAMHADREAALDEAKLRAARMEVRSASAGIVMVRRGAPGMRLMVDGNGAEEAYLVELYDPKKLQVRADVPLSDGAKIGVGQRAQIIVDVLPDRVFTGRVTRLVHQADIGKNTIQVKVAIDDPSPQLKPEMLARVKFLSAGAAASVNPAAPSPATAATAGALRVFVPQKLVHDRAGQRVVWIVDAATRTARSRAVTLGTAQHEGWIEIAAGVNPNDALIAQSEGLTESQRVRVTAEENGK